jgi:hypothetical protein
MIALALLSAWAVSINSVSTLNAQLAENQRKGDCARAAAESGLEITRYWLNRFSVAGTTDESLVFGNLQTDLANDLVANGVYNISPNCEVAGVITIPAVTLDLADGRSFSAFISQFDADTIRLEVIGSYGSITPITRKIQVDYEFGQRAHQVFDYGVATKGPLSLSGNIDLEGVNIAVESSVFIVSENSNLALEIIGNSSIAGDVSIANPLANVNLQGGHASIGGETGQDAIDNHVSFGIEPPEFPVPDPGYFEHYVQNVFDPANILREYENVRIPANTNPIFTRNVTLKGIVYIETPNVVTFRGNAAITGIIVGNGSVADSSGTNRITFLGTVDSHPVTQLPAEPQFAGIHEEAGTFLMAPGFHLSFGGNFSTLNGAIAGNGVEFFGNAGGIINGSVINYADEQMTFSGNSDLQFNRSGTVEVPAGFVPEIILKYEPSSYSEVVL